MHDFISSHFQPSFLIPTIFVKNLYFMNWPLEIATESYTPTRTSYTSGHIIKITHMNAKKIEALILCCIYNTRAEIDDANKNDTEK